MFLAVHECGHFSKWRDKNAAPQPGERVVCNYCTKVSVVTELLGPHRAKCADCRRVNHHAVFRKTAMEHATTHVQEWTTHRVWVWRYGDPDSRILVTVDKAGAQLPLFSDAPF